jgi:hypothetical protein
LLNKKEPKKMSVFLPSINEKKEDFYSIKPLNQSEYIQYTYGRNDKPSTLIKKYVNKTPVWSEGKY